MSVYKRILLFLFFLFVCSIGFVSAQDLRKLPSQERERMILKIAKEALLKYGDEEYYRASLTPRITTEVMSGGVYVGREFYVVTYPYDTTNYFMEKNFAAEVKIFSDTGKIGFIMFGDGWGLAIDWLIEHSYKIEKAVFDTTMRKEWLIQVKKMWEEVRRKEELAQVAYDERLERFQDSVRRVRNFVVDLRSLSADTCKRVLLKLADEAVLQYGAPEYFAACLPPTIVSDTMSYGDFQGREYYLVTYPYDTTKYAMPRDYAAAVEIWKDSGVVYHTYFGNGEMIVGLWFFNPGFEPDKIPFDESFRKK